MARIPIPCGHIDYPCCGCDDVALTGQDAIDQEYDGDEADSYALASAGRGTDEDYGYYVPDMHDIMMEDRMSSEC